MTDVLAISRAQRLAILTDDSIVPITVLIDPDGDETEEMAEASAFVAGEGDRWFARLFSDFGETYLI